MRGARVVVLVSAIGASFAACGVSSTTVTLNVTSDVPCAELKGVSISVTTVGTPGEREVRTGQCTDGPHEARIGSLVIDPGHGDNATIAMRVVAGVDRPVSDCSAASAWAGCIVARRAIRFVSGRDIDLRIALRKECTSIACDDTSTCVRGTCRSATVDDPSSCVDAPCNEGNLGPTADAGADAPVVDTGTPIVEAGPPADSGSPDVIVPVDGGPTCGASEKLCDGKCVSQNDPEFGCQPAGCSPCPDLSIADYACASQKCALLQCKTGFKKCGTGCVAADVDHGCSDASCTPCDATNGTASCDSTGKCKLACSAGFKLCGGKCVSVADPTYGCGPTSCSAASCPNPGGGTLACSGSACVIGTCPVGTKNCNQKCVPKDVQNGCDSPTRCTACPTGNVCSGAPSVCTCVPESTQTTCAGKSCGPATNNCGQTIQCQDKCRAPETCGGGGATQNSCGCTRNPECQGMNCGGYYDNCGYYVTCGGCGWPEFCGGGGYNVCGAPPDGDCGPNWPSMGTFTCDDQKREWQTICGCHPQGYSDSALWLRQGDDCYTHLTGRGC